ncbi:hypothetical protein [Vreelandella venusta]|uniref:Uncharacterized protein n=1 Tax=Vreelandella venusta TaxID=44935 RepID=A0AAP9ZH23_9GAMM|nr:hypothetical protein [Halomonas venusta]QRL05165.1 hypothetical protein JDS37_09630 [Halomonas venusta]GEK50936.1 hypothetical protein HVE01_16570 [Halomonas venusta]
MSASIRQSKIVADPHTGEKVTLHELAKRYGLRRTTVRARYDRGQRGMDLIEQPTTGNISDSVRERIAMENRKCFIERAKHSPLAMPLNHIAQASKLAGGAV